MAYGLYLTLDQPRWFRGDFSDTDLLTGTIFTDINKQTARNITGYTITLRMHRPKHFGDFFGKTATIVSGAGGTWSYAVAEGEMPPRGIYYFKVEISQAGQGISTINRVQLQVLEGPSVSPT